MNELRFLKHLKHKLEECGLEDTYLNDIVKCRRIIDDRIVLVKNCDIAGVVCSEAFKLYETCKKGKEEMCTCKSDGDCANKSVTEFVCPRREKSGSVMNYDENRNDCWNCGHTWAI